MAQRRAGVELNFDGLTDSVTNLVGSLILLVVLVVAVTGPKVAGIEELPPPDNEPGAEQEVDLLLEQIRVLKLEVQTVDRDIQGMEARLPEIAAELDELRRQSEELFRAGPT